ncbi:unnamed protein product [Cuscuta campestris]|uniref:Uncharacterized protein n=1 Tax=Cuscuta campestris TaxID=132261 RepID=A0A484L5K8_9ASTE|nr:unnamed protein product [Cuscuta campestris]
MLGQWGRNEEDKGRKGEKIGGFSSKIQNGKEESPPHRYCTSCRPPPIGPAVSPKSSSPPKNLISAAIPSRSPALSPGESRHHRLAVNASTTTVPGEREMFVGMVWNCAADMKILLTTAQIRRRHRCSDPPPPPLLKPTATAAQIRRRHRCSNLPSPPLLRSIAAVAQARHCRSSGPSSSGKSRGPKGFKSTAAEKSRMPTSSGIRREPNPG